MCEHVYLKDLHLRHEKKSQVADKLENILSETKELRKNLIKEGRGEIRLQTNQEFNQNEIKEIAKKYNVVHFNSRLNDGHAVGAEQKIRELKNQLKNSKRMLKTGKLKSNEALKKATNNMNIFPTGKYSIPPEEVEKKSLDSEEYKLEYDFKRLKKVGKDAQRYSRYNAKRDK